MGMWAADIPYLRIGSKRGYGVINLDQIKVTPDNWRHWITHFAPPPDNLSIEFPGINVLDRNSCSACQSTLFLFLKRYGETILEYFPDEVSVNFAIGKGNPEVPADTICVGNCRARHRDRGVFIPGCPRSAVKFSMALPENYLSTGRMSVSMVKILDSPPGS